MPPFFKAKIREEAEAELERRRERKRRAAEASESAREKAQSEWGRARRTLQFYGNNLTFYRKTESPRILSGPSETGKTITCLSLLDELAWAYAGMQGAIIRSTYESMPASVLQTFEKKVLAENTPVTKYGGEKPQFYDYPNGSRIWVGGMDKPSKALSSERDVIYINQTEELSVEQFETLTTRATGRAGNMPLSLVFGDCNPGPSTHWIKSKEAEGTLKLYESRHEDNPVLFNQETGEITEQGKRSISILDRLTGVLYLRLRKGLWASAEGVVYDEWDRAIHYIDGALTEIKFHVAGVDWGFTNPGVIQVWGVDSDRRMYRVREIYQTGKLVAASKPEDAWWIEQAKDLRDEFRVMVFACDPSEPAYIKAFRMAGLQCVEAFNDISLGIQNVESRLKVQDDGRARLYYLKDALVSRDDSLKRVHRPTCSEEEIEVYVWPKGADGKAQKEKPVDDNNHGMDAMRYAAAYVDGLGRAKNEKKSRSYSMSAFGK